MNFEPVTTLDDLDSLDDAEMYEGYSTTMRGDPEPGPNRGRSFWHGWRTRMMDYGEIAIDAKHRALVHGWLKRERKSITRSKDGRENGEASIAARVEMDAP